MGTTCGASELRILMPGKRRAAGNPKKIIKATPAARPDSFLSRLPRKIQEFRHADNAEGHRPSAPKSKRSKTADVG